LTTLDRVNYSFFSTPLSFADYSFSLQLIVGYIEFKASFEILTFDGRKNYNPKICFIMEVNGIKDSNLLTKLLTCMLLATVLFPNYLKLCTLTNVYIYKANKNFVCLFVLIVIQRH
jgi:hypothetical protein